MTDERNRCGAPIEPEEAAVLAARIDEGGGSGLFARVLAALVLDLSTRMIRKGHSIAWRAVNAGHRLTGTHKTFVFVACDLEAEKAYAALRAAGLLCETDLGVGDPKLTSDPFANGSLLLEDAGHTSSDMTEVVREELRELLGKPSDWNPSASLLQALLVREMRELKDRRAAYGRGGGGQAYASHPSGGGGLGAGGVASGGPGGNSGIIDGVMVGGGGGSGGFFASTGSGGNGGYVGDPGPLHESTGGAGGQIDSALVQAAQRLVEQRRLARLRVQALQPQARAEFEARRLVAGGQHVTNPHAINPQIIEAWYREHGVEVRADIHPNDPKNVVLDPIRLVSGFDPSATRGCGP